MADVHVELHEVLRALSNQLNRSNPNYQTLVEFVQIILNQERLPTTSDVFARIDGVTAAVTTLSNVLAARIGALEGNMVTREQVESLKTALDASNATIAEISGDMAELVASTTDLSSKVAELEAQLAGMNDPEVDRIMGEVRAAVDAQATALRGIADVVPEVPTPSPEPTEPPAEPPPAV